jgi:23S rRNA pseudouridine955/2504/2580 synthase
MLTLLIDDKDHCRRVDSLLRNLLPGAPLAYLRKLLTSGHVHVNGVEPDATALLQHGDQVTIKESARLTALLVESRSGLDIVFEDRWIIMFNKPGGMPMHRAAEVDDRNLVDVGTILMRWRGEEGKLRPVNRLDRGTSGAVILAKTPSAAGMFGRFVKEEGLDKLYLAVVAGELSGAGSIDEPLDGKESSTSYQVLCSGNGLAVVALAPVTGRMHQIRQHLTLIGHPVMGDVRYKGYPLPAGYPGFALHSFRTAFTHPDSGRYETVYAPLPSPFLELMATCNREASAELLPRLAELALDL